MGERAGQSRIIGECHHSSSAQRFELDFNDEVTTDVVFGRSVIEPVQVSALVKSGIHSVGILVARNIWYTVNGPS